MDTYKLVACEVLRDEVEHLLAHSSSDRVFDIEWMQMGLHDEPERLHRELAEKIRSYEGKGYAAVLLLFGLCSRATAELTPPSDSILVMPKVHDCVSIFLGSHARFQQEHDAIAGTFWFSRGFLHRPDGRETEFTGLGAVGGFVTGDDGIRRTPHEIRQHFVQEYGEDNAEYLMETLVESWKKNYRRAVYLDWPASESGEQDKQYVRCYAQDNNWDFAAMPVDLRLVRGLLFGPWNKDEFLIVNPGEHSIATNDEQIVTKAKVDVQP